MYIDMSCSALNRISIETGYTNHAIDPHYPRPKELDTMEAEINSIGNIYLYLKTESSAEQHFVLQSGQNTINIISQKEYALYSNESVTIHINCKSLRALRIHLTNCDIGMTWDANGALCQQTV
ncbi:hypothetical protein V8B55DRAFT_1530358 [Mucor lusitanicus]